MMDFKLKLKFIKMHTNITPLSNYKRCIREMAVLKFIF